MRNIFFCSLYEDNNYEIFILLEIVSLFILHLHHPGHKTVEQGIIILAYYFDDPSVKMVVVLLSSNSDLFSSITPISLLVLD